MFADKSSQHCIGFWGEDDEGMDELLAILDGDNQDQPLPTPQRTEGTKVFFPFFSFAFELRRRNSAHQRCFRSVFCLFFVCLCRLLCPQQRTEGLFASVDSFAHNSPLRVCLPLSTPLPTTAH